MLVRLMYASRAAESVDQDELLAILRQSKGANASLGITGVLCFSGGIFLQALEGGRMQVNTLYNRIAADKRHRDVVLLTYEEIGERRFAGWSMGQVDMSRLNPALLLKHSERPVLDPYALPASASMALLQELMATASIVGNA